MFCFILISNVQTYLRLTTSKYKHSLTMIYLVGEFSFFWMCVHWQLYIWWGSLFFWMCVHLLWSAGGYWPTYANWVPSSRENYSPRPLEQMLLALSFFWIFNVLYTDKLFWMIRETLFVKTSSAQMEKHLPEILPQRALFDWVVSVFFISIIWEIFF